MQNKSNKTTTTLLFVGDVIGEQGQNVLEQQIRILSQQYSIDGIIVNGENSAYDGRGITPKELSRFEAMGVNMITTGNHVWAKKEIYPFLESKKFILRPANFPSGCPGTGVSLFYLRNNSEKGIGVINIQGRVFMRELVSCPFRALDSAISYVKSLTNHIIVDIHAETTSEKHALAYYVDGKVSAILGTHTHVQTADERILENGTAYITDVGMVGALNSVIGMKSESILKNMITQMPTKFIVEEKAPYVFSSVLITIDSQGKAQKIERLRIVN